MQFVALILITTHWLACLAYLVIMIENSEVNWLYCYDHLEVRNSCAVPSTILNSTIVNGSISNNVQTPALSLSESGEPFERYVLSLYWSTMTVLTIGYGDVKPKTDGERMVDLFAMIIGASIYAYVVGGACQLISKMDWHSNLFYARLDDINEYMQSNQIPSDMQQEVRKYFHYARHTDKNKVIRRRLKLLSPDMMGEINGFVFRSLLAKVSYMQDLSSVAMTDLAVAMEETAFPAGEIVCRKGNTADNMYLTVTGLLVTRSIGGTLKFVGAGACFGKELLLSERHIRHRTVASVTPVQCLRINRKDLWVIIEKHEELKYQIEQEAFYMAVCYFAAGVKEARGMAHPAVCNSGCECGPCSSTVHRPFLSPRSSGPNMRPSYFKSTGRGAAIDELIGVAPFSTIGGKAIDVAPGSTDHTMESTVGFSETENGMLTMLSEMRHDAMSVLSDVRAQQDQLEELLQVERRKR